MLRIISLVLRKKPIIGIAGGIGSGKSFVARLFGEMGCLVIDSDEQVRAAYLEPRVTDALRRWWGDEAFEPGTGEINRRFIGRKVFADEGERRRLEALIHPVVNEYRKAAMAAAADDPQVLAYVWDTPLLFETGLQRECDALVYVETPEEVRRERVARTRGWDAAELERRQKLQWPLDTKRQMSDYVVTNTADADYARGQVRDVLSRILARSQAGPVSGRG